MAIYAHRSDWVSTYIEDLHTLLHRWVQKHGWPDDSDAEGFALIMKLANRVEQEAKDLTRAFAGYVIKFGNPEWAAAHGEEYKAQMAKPFHEAHIED